MLDPAESEFLLQGMKTALDLVETREQLVQWATENKTNKERLQPKDQDIINSEFKAVQVYLKEKAEKAEKAESFE